LCLVGAVVLVMPLALGGGARAVWWPLCAASVLIAVPAGIRLHRPVPASPWWILLAATAFLVLGTVVRAVPAVAAALGATPAADLLHYAACAGFGVALVLLPGPRGLRTGYAEAVIITCGVAVLWWTVLIDPLVSGARWTPDRIHVAYPGTDLVILALGLRLLLGGAGSATHRLIVVAAAMLLFADTALVLEVAEGTEPPVLSLLGWVLAAVAVGAAALHPAMARIPDRLPDELPDRLGTRLCAGTVIATPLIAGVFLLRESRYDRVAPADVLVAVGAIAVSATLMAALWLRLSLVSREHAAALRRELRENTQHDALTGLPNRSMLDDRITAALAEETPGVLLVLDLDGFKEVNDRFGHALGDHLLLEVTARLRAVLGADALLARLDSDEFAVLLTGAEQPRAEACANDILVAMRRPVQVRGHEMFATASIGLRRLKRGLSADDTLRDAYLALRAAKAAGHDQLAVYDRRLGEDFLAAARTVERLRGAIERDELLLYYQPLIRLADESMVGVEALLRWQPAGEAMIPPDRFIPAAEDSGLIVGIGAWVLRRSCAVVADWHRRYGAVVSVNVSPRQLREPDFAAQVLDALQAATLPPDALILEITEGVLVASGVVTEQAIRHLTLLRERGVRVAVDDFGTGYSSLAYLRDLPIDHIKIDKSFMPARDAPDPAARTLIKAVIDLAAGLRLGTIAEGVETREQVELLRELGCERAQGYYFARPVPPAEAAELLARTRRIGV
jgi:diguanylate cyclase (GGDEF)-like protein